MNSSNKPHKKKKRNTTTSPVGGSLSLGQVVEGLAKRLKLSRSTAAALVLSVLLVAAEVKAAYLVDACFLSAAQAEGLLRELSPCFPAVDLSASLAVVCVEEHVFFVNRAALRRRSERLSADTLPLLVVDLDRATCEDLSLSPLQREHELKAFLLSISSLILSLSSPSAAVVIDSRTEGFAQMGAPVVAGFLLGYAALYWARPENDNGGEGVGAYRRGSERLSHSSLWRTSASLRLRAASTNVLAGCFQRETVLRILEFTVPAALIANKNSDGDGDDNAFNDRENKSIADQERNTTRNAEFLRDSIACLQSEMQISLQTALSEQGILSKIFSKAEIFFEEEIITTESISL